MSDENVLAIDRNRLDDEWERQPKLYREYAMDLADARYTLELAEYDLGIEKARISEDVRTDPDRYGLSKITEPAVKAILESHKTLARLEKKVLEKKHTVRMLESMVNALDHKRTSLKYITERQLAGEIGESAFSTYSDKEKRSIRSRGRDRMRREKESDYD
jgi:hypothetical protein